MTSIQKPGKKPEKKTQAKKKATEKEKSVDEIKEEYEKSVSSAIRSESKLEVIPANLPVKKETPGVALTTLEDLSRFSQAIAKSGMFPGIQDQFQALSVIEYGRELGLKPIVSLQTMTVIKGRLCIYTQALAAMAMDNGISIEVIKKDTKGCTLKFSRAGQEVSHTASFTEDDAKRAGLLGKDNYMNYPEDMYYWRAVARGVKVFAPGLALGLNTAEELDGLPDLISKDKKKKKEKPAEDVKTVTIVKEKPEPEPEEEKEEEPAPEPPPKEPKEPDTSSEHALEFEETIKDIKMRLEKAEIKEQLFKKYLHEELQPVKPDRSFVQPNQYGHLSFHSGKLDDLKIILAHFEWFCGEYVMSKTFEESAKDKPAVDPI